MIHGDLKGVRQFTARGIPHLTAFTSLKANILIDQTCNARLADFGLLAFISDPTNTLSSSSYAQGGTTRWMSPELIAPERFGMENSLPTKASDCYALGMVIYETISGKVPFHRHTCPAVILKVLEGERPPRGVWFTGGLWKTLEQCWKPRPKSRPSIEDVLHCLEMPSNLLEPPSGADKITWDSASSSPGVPNWTSSTMATKRSTTLSSGWSHRASHPLSEADVNRLGHEATGPDFMIPWIDSNEGDNSYQVTAANLTRP